MKSIGLKLTDDAVCDCLDILIKNICEWKKTDYRMIFSEAWGFRYEDGNGSTIAERISEDRGDRDYYLSAFHGVNMRRVPYKPELAPLISDEINRGNPVLLRVDSFFCEWDFTFYNRLHQPHYLCVVGYDDSMNTFLCYDLNMAIDGKQLTIADFNLFCNSVVFFTFGNEPILFNAEGVLNKFRTRLLGTNGQPRIGDAIRKFIFDLESMNFEHEFEDSTPEYSLLFQRIAVIARNREKFIETLACIEENDSGYNFDKEKSEIRNLASEWQMALAMFMKAYYMADKTNILLRICEKFRQIAIHEDKIAEMLAANKQLARDPDECKNTVRNDKRSETSQFHGLKYQPILIKPYMNNNGVFNQITDDCSSELSNPHRYFYYDHKSFTFNHGGIILHAENFDVDLFDNIACNGQAISIGINNPKSITILACAEFGSFKEDIKLVFDSGEDHLNMGFTSWLSPCPKFGEEIAVTGKGIEKEKNLQAYPYPVFLYSSTERIDKIGYLETIMLPLCLNVHIFALTIGF